MSIARTEHTANLLPSGKVLVIGGYTTVARVAGGLWSAELYDPATDTWLAAGEMYTARYAHTAVALPSGTVLAAGGTNWWDGTLANAELYGPRAVLAAGCL